MMPEDLPLGAPMTAERYRMTDAEYAPALLQIPREQRQAVVQEVNQALAAINVPPGLAKGLMGFFASNKITGLAEQTKAANTWRAFADRKYGADFPAMQRQARAFLDASGAQLWKDVPAHLLENSWLVETLLRIRDNGAKWKALKK